MLTTVTSAFVCNPFSCCPHAVKRHLAHTDLTNKKSFGKVKFWVEELLTNEPKCTVYIVGTKLDLVQEGASRGMDASVVSDYANEIGAKCWELSAKSGHNVEEIFADVARQHVDAARARGGPTEYKDVKRLDDAGRAGKKGCCK